MLSSQVSLLTGGLTTSLMGWFVGFAAVSSSVSWLVSLSLVGLLRLVGCVWLVEVGWLRGLLVGLAGPVALFRTKTHLFLRGPRSKSLSCTCAITAFLALAHVLANEPKSTNGPSLFYARRQKTLKTRTKREARMDGQKIMLSK